MKFLFSLIGTMMLLSPICTYGQTAKVGDINGDGKVTVSDVLSLVQIVLNEEDENQPTDEAGEAIDLGLPSGIKWASCNVGATSPEGCGGYYAWGEIEEKSIYSKDTYIYYRNASYENIGYNISGTQYDVAQAKWGGKWRMPTKDEITELLNYCTNKWITLNGVKGTIFTSKTNGKSIFLPASGNRTNNKLYNKGSFGDYWTGTHLTNSDYSAFLLGTSSDRASLGSTVRSSGRSVRPVTKSSNQSNIDKTICDINGDETITISDVLALVQIVLNDEEDENQPSAEAGEAIDLGLPSGTKWANCNVGATKPEEYGGYYAWGETEEKDTYTWDTYIHCNGSMDSCHDLGADISGTQYDVAHVKWGGNWCMPTLEEIKELRDNCTHEWTTLNGVNGRKFTSKINGKSIFFPAAGKRWYGLDDAGEGSYWSSTQYPGYSYGAGILYFHSGGAYWAYSSRNDGRSVRPVVRN